MEQPLIGWMSGESFASPKSCSRGGRQRERWRWVPIISFRAPAVRLFYNRLSRPTMSHDDAVARLARQIDATRTSERFLVDAGEVAASRQHGARELHRICMEFVSSVNGNMSVATLDLSPATFAPEMFRESGVNLIQISSQGREIQIAFEAPAQLVSTEKFLIPYVLEGEVRAYNQKMLERFEIRSRLLFFCVEAGTAAWRFFDWRTRHTGPVDRKFLAGLMEPLF